MRTHKNVEDLLVTRQKASPIPGNTTAEITFLVPQDKPMPTAQDKIAMGVHQGTTGKNAGFPVNVLFCITEIVLVGSVNPEQEDAAPTDLKVVAKVIRQEV